jgi:hypothetical protein
VLLFVLRLGTTVDACLCVRVCVRRVCVCVCVCMRVCMRARVGACVCGSRHGLTRHTAWLWRSTTSRASTGKSWRKQDSIVETWVTEA